MSDKTIDERIEEVLGMRQEDWQEEYNGIKQIISDILNSIEVPEKKLEQLLVILWKTAYTRYGMGNENLDVDEATQAITDLFQQAIKDKLLDRDWETS